MNWKQLRAVVLAGVAACLILAPSVGRAQEKKAKQEPAPRITDPAVLSIIESKPETPAALFRAVQLLADLNQPTLAREYLQKLIELKPDDATLAALAEKIGTAELMRFAKIEALAPEAQSFATAAIDASARVARDPERLQKFAGDLASGDVATKEDAIVGLTRGGGASVWPLLTVLEAANRANEHAAVRGMILRLGSSAVGPLTSVLEGGSAAQKQLAAELLARLPATQAVPALVQVYAEPESSGALKAAAKVAIEAITGAKLTPADAQQYLERQAKQKLDQARLVESQDDYGMPKPATVVWRWSAEEGRPVQSDEPLANALRGEALEAARALLAGDPKSHALQQLYLTALLEQAKYRTGLDRPLPADAFNAATGFGLDALDDLLRNAMKQGNTAAAIAAAEVLGKLGSLALVQRSDGRTSALAEAAKSPDRRVRFAATQAILNLRPTTSFAGASAIGEGLKFFANTSGFRRALVADPRAAVAQQVASYLNQLGYETDIATNGRDAFQKAVDSPDYELMYVHAAIDKPRADDLVAQLRKDSRTANLPLAIVAIPTHPESAERLARGVPRAYVVAEPQNAETVKEQVERLLGLPGCAPVPAAVRKSQALWSIATLADLAEKPLPWLNARGISKSVERSLYAPGMTSAIVPLLANAGTATGQSELVQLAARASLPLPTRELAATAFARSVAQHGVLLTQDQILKQYDLYNANAGQNRETHEVMLKVIEALEGVAEEKKPPTE